MCGRTAVPVRAVSACKGAWLWSSVLVGGLVVPTSGWSEGWLPSCRLVCRYAASLLARMQRFKILVFPVSGSLAEFRRMYPED